MTEKNKNELERENIGLTEMLAAVLASVGEPVTVYKETLVKITDCRIEILEDIAKSAFIFKLVPNEQ